MVLEIFGPVNGTGQMEWAQWNPVTPPAEWGDIELPEYLKSLGYDPTAVMQLGNHEYGFEIEVFRPEKSENQCVDQLTRYLIIVSFGYTCEIVYCAGRGALLEFLRRYAPIYREMAFDADRKDERECLIDHKGGPVFTCRYCAANSPLRLSRTPVHGL